jgi:hypothetical protein
MGKSNTTSNDVLKCILKGVDPTYRNANATLYVALHTANPTATGTQKSSEIAYTDYERMPITKATGWTDNGTNFTNAAQINFIVCGAVGATAKYVSIGELTTGGDGQIYYVGQLTDDLVIALNIQPIFSIGNLMVTES